MKTLVHRFVDKIPDHIEDGVIYVSIPFETVIHKCCCGCGNEVVTPLSPTDWSLTFNGESISLDPSIGNWSFKCRSHYWITENQVIWSNQWGSRKIEEVRREEFAAKRDFYNKKTDNLGGKRKSTTKKGGLRGLFKKK